MDAAEGSLEGARVVVAAGRGASALHSKGSHGTPMSGGGLELTLAEAAYLLEAGRLKVREGDAWTALEDLLAVGSNADPGFEVRYLVYRDFRERGYVVREEPPSAHMHFSVRARGARGRSPSKMWVLAVPERGEFSAPSSAEFAQRAAALGKEAVLAVVDEEGDITYYALEPGLKPFPSKARARATASGVLSGNHVIVRGEDAEALHAEDELLGKTLKHLLRLSLIEAAYLLEAGQLSLTSLAGGGREVSPSALAEYGSKVQRDFARRLAVYRALRARGLVPKTGFKYGAHFRVYDREGGSTHARYLVHAVPQDFACPWPELARAVRLAHGVKKRLAYALVEEGGDVDFLKVRWTRP